jgi:folate-binding protein YgfZ
MEDVQPEDATREYRVSWLYAPDGTSGFSVPHFADDRVSWHLGKREDEPGFSGESRVDASQRDLVTVLLGIPSAPAELNEQFTPYDVNLRHLISFTKGCYIGQEVIARLDTYGKAHRGLFLLFTTDPGHHPVPGPLFRSGSPCGTLTTVSSKDADGIRFGLGVMDMRLVTSGDGVETESGISLRLNELPHRVS